MTIRLSTGLRNAVTGTLGFAGALAKGTIEIYTGTQPTSADAAITGTLIGIVTLTDDYCGRVIWVYQHRNCRNAKHHP